MYNNYFNIIFSIKYYMTLKLIFNITLTFIIIYIFFIYSVEHVENTTTGQTNTQFTDQQKIDIKNIINDLYMTDVDAIRNLSDVATKLQTQNKLILPGQLNVQDKLATNNLDPSNMPTGWTGGLRFIDGYASGNMGFGPNVTTINAQIDKDGNINGKKLTFIDGNVSGNMVFGPNATTINAEIDKNGNITSKGNLNVDNGSISIVSSTDNPVHLKLLNTLKFGNDEVLQWSISNMKSNSNNKNDNKLSFSRTLANNISTYTPSLELYDSGNVNIPGNLTVNNIITKKNRARFIRVGNMKSIRIFTEAEFRSIGLSLIIPSNTTTPTATVTNSSLAIDNWSLIEIRVFDDTGKNIASEGNVTIEHGSKGIIRWVNNHNNHNDHKNIINGKIFEDPKNPTDNILHGYYGSTGPQQLQIELKDEYNISQIQLFNRQVLSETKKMNDTIVELISDIGPKKYITGDTDDAKIDPLLIVNRRINTGLWDGIYYKEFIL